MTHGNSNDPRKERLRAELELKRAALAEHRAELLKLQNEMGAFAQLYDRVVGPLEAQLDAVRQQIESLQSFSASVSDAYSESIWGGYGSLEESFDAKYRRQEDPAVLSSRRIVDETSLRTLYRKLARKYHPDTTADPAEKQRLTVIMAQVNAAYRAKNIDELRALDGSRPAQVRMPDVKPLTPHEPSLFDLMEMGRKLDDEIAVVKIEYQRMMTSPLMQLKIEHSLARSRGRDLLREIANRIRADLQAAQKELIEERRKRHL